MSLSGPLDETFGKRLNAYLTSPQDFRKHRQKIARELLRLRHDLNLITKDTKNYREKEKTSAIGPEQYEENAKYGNVLLLLAERNLVHSLEVKSMSELKGQQIPGAKKLMASKLKSAAKTGEKLVGVVAGERNASKRLEFYVFAALVHGQYAVNKKRWNDARYAFSAARVGLEFLAAELASSASGNSAEDSSFGKILIDEIIETLVDPSLSLANSQDFSGGKTTADLRTVARKHCHDRNVPYLAGLVDLVSAQDPAFVNEIAEENVEKSVTWRAHSAAIYNDELAVNLSKVRQEDWKSYTEANDFDSLFSRWAALVDTHQADLEKSTDDDDMEKNQDNAVLMTFLKYHMLFVKVKRDLLLTEKLQAQPTPTAVKVLAANKDISRLYKSLAATTDELKDLPGVYNDEELYESLDELSKLFTVADSAVIADSYAAANKLPEALAIYVHIQRTFSTATQYFKVDSFPYEVSSNEQVAQFRAKLSAQMAKIHTLAQMQRESEGLAPSTVADNVYKYPASAESLSNITSVTEKGAITPVMCKPVLFDVAFNYIGYGGEKESKTAQPQTESTSEPSEKKKGGFFGMFGRN